MTELKKLRLRYGINVNELCEEIGMSKALYSMHENGMRTYSEDKYEEFFFKVSQALVRIEQRRRKESLKEPIYRNKGLTYNDKKLHQLMKLEKDVDDEEELVYPPITEFVFKQAVKMALEGKNVIQIATTLGVCEKELGKKLGEIKTDFKIETLLQQ